MIFLSANNSEFESSITGLSVAAHRDLRRLMAPTSIKALQAMDGADLATARIGDRDFFN